MVQHTIEDIHQNSISITFDPMFEYAPAETAVYLQLPVTIRFDEKYYDSVLRVSQIAWNKALRSNDLDTKKALGFLLMTKGHAYFNPAYYRTSTGKRFRSVVIRNPGG